MSDGLSIRTVNGIYINPLDAKPEEIDINDIAHALSFLCRANGHYRKFYSVGAHSINCYEEACNRVESTRVKLACLLHDATEAYMCDLTRPVKRSITEYSVYEEKLADVIYNKFLGSSLSDYEKHIVKEIDDAMLYYEFYEFTAVKLMDEAPYVAATPNYFQGDFSMVEKKFLLIADELLVKLKEEAEDRERRIRGEDVLRKSDASEIDATKKAAYDLQGENMGGGNLYGENSDGENSDYKKDPERKTIKIDFNKLFI